MIYVCVPVHNEARTAGLVLWKVRQVFTAFPREYQLLVLDDASTDDTREVLASYAKVLPMTIVTHRERRGYARSLEELLRLALQRTDRPKRDCAITLHADFVHSPESMEDLVKHLESGADLVVAELLQQRGRVSRALGLARRWTPRLLRVAGLRDTVSGFLALRLIVLRQALRQDTPQFLRTEGWCASAELVARLAPHARRLDAVPAAARYDLVQRPSRIRPWRQLLEAWRARSVIRAARTVVALVLMAVGKRHLPVRHGDRHAPRPRGGAVPCRRAAGVRGAVRALQRRHRLDAGRGDRHHPRRRDGSLRVPDRWRRVVVPHPPEPRVVGGTSRLPLAPLPESDRGKRQIVGAEIRNLPGLRYLPGSRARYDGPDRGRPARRRRLSLLDPHRAARNREALRVPPLF